MTCGPWRPIELEVYTFRIADLYFTTEVDKSLKSAEVVAKADVEGEDEGSEVRFEISVNGKAVGSETVRVQEGYATATFRTQDPELWYPATYGKQPLYLLTANLISGDKVYDKASKRFGLRRAQLIQRKLDDAPGTTFFFEINNIPIFCGGSNWIPADNFIPRIKPQRYRDWVKLIVDGNQVMVRVWGGGIFEEQTLYDACDEMGVLVWQDFLFGCGNYPAFPDFLDLVKREATANVKLLRHHPSIVIWAGNNEDYQYQESENLDYDPNDKDPQNWLKSSFPARYIYEKVLVDVTKELVPTTYYHFGSPWGGSNTRDPTAGDIHQWNGIRCSNSRLIWQRLLTSDSSMARYTGEVSKLRQVGRSIRFRVRHGSVRQHQNHQQLPPEREKGRGQIPAIFDGRLPQQGGRSRATDSIVPR